MPSGPSIPRPSSPGTSNGQVGGSAADGSWIWQTNVTDASGRAGDWVWHSTGGDPSQHVTGNSAGTPSIGQLTGLNAQLAGSPGATLDTSRADAQRGDTGALIALLQQQAATGDGAWEQSFSNAVKNAQAGASAVGQSEAAQARSGYAGALRNIGNAQSAIGQRAVNEGAALRAETQGNAQDQLAQLLAAQGQGDIAQSAAEAAVLQARRQAETTIEQQQNNDVMSGIQAGGQGITTLAAMSDGGRVPGRPKVFGDDERNDTVPAWLSPREIVIPLSIAERHDAPAASARFVAAVKAGSSPGKAATFAREARRMAGGGSAWQPGEPDPSVGSGQFLFGVPQQTAGVNNGAILDTSQYDATREQLGNVANLLTARASGSGSVADTIAKTQQDDAVAKELQAQNNRRVAVANAMQSMAAEGAKTAGAAGAKRAEDQAAAQKTLGNLDITRRAQELGLSEAQQQALWGNTMLNMGLSLNNQALLRNQLAAAGQGATTLASLAKNSDTGVSTPVPTSNPTTSAAAEAAFNAEPDSMGAGSAPGDYPTGGDGAQTAAHGGLIGRRFARAARMAKGGDVAHLTILVPAGAATPPPPSLVLMPSMPSANGRNLALAARRMADGGLLSDANVPPSGGMAPSLQRIAEMRHAQAASRVAPNAGPADVRVVRDSGLARNTLAQMRQEYDAEHQGALDKLAQTIRDGARMAAGYAAVPHLAEGGGVPDAEVADAGEPLIRDSGPTVYGENGVPVAPGNFTPGPAPDAGVPAPQASFQPPPGTAGLDRVGPNGEAIPWEKSLEHAETTPPPAKLPPMRPPPVAPPAPSAAPTVTPHADALHAPYAKPGPDSFDERMAARRREGELEAQKAADLAKAQGAYQQQLQRNALEQQDLVKRADADAQSLMGRYNDAVEQMKRIDTSIDPGRFWASRSTGQKVMGIIGMAFSALGSRDGTNRAAELLGKAIDRDVDAQKAEVDARMRKGQGAMSAAQSAYAMNRQLFQSDLAANAATKASLLDLSINQAEQIKTAYAGKLAGPEADEFIAQLKQARNQYLQQAQAQVVENNLKRSQTVENYAQAAAAGAKGSNLTPERQKAIDEVETQSRNIRNNIDKARAIIQRSGTFELMGTDEPELKRALNFIANDTAKLKDPGSTNRESEIENAKKDLGLKGGELTVRNSVALKLLDDFERDIMQRRKNEYETRGLRAPAFAPSAAQLEE